MTETFVEQDLNSLHDPSLDINLTKFSELDTCCTYESNICDESNYSISPVSFSIIDINPLLNTNSLLGTNPFPHKETTIVVDTLTGFENNDLFKHFDFSELSSIDNTFIRDSCIGSSICQIRVEIDKCITCGVDTSNTTPGLTNKP